jgi:ABC-type multidrug transport system ATPase subunit
MIPTTNLSQGSVSVPGVDSRQLSARELRRIGYDSENQDMPARLTVSEYLDYLRAVLSALRSLAVAAP